MTSQKRLDARARRRPLESVAARQGWVVSTHQALRSGLTAEEIAADVAGRRWMRAGHQCLVLHTGPLDQNAREWLAVLDAGPRAALDGASSLVRAGLTKFVPERIRVSVPRGVPVERSDWLDVRQTRRWSAEDLADDDIPRTRNEVAAVRAGLWARSDRQAALLVSMVVQQDLVTPGQLAAQMLRIRRDKRRMLMNDLVLEVGGGAESLGEIDVARECRSRGMPEPARQSVRRGREGRWYLDAEWPQFGVVLEIDGIHHAWAQNVVGDALRQNRLALDGSLVLRLPLSGLRFAPEEFFGQIEEALVRRGWRGRFASAQSDVIRIRG